MADASYVLHARRLVLRPVEPGDVDALHRHWTEAEVRRYLWDDVSIPRSEVEDLVARSARCFAEEGYGLWALHARAGGPLLGCAGYWTFHEPPQVELVLSLSHAYWHGGLAAEAGAVLLTYARDVLGMAEARASTDAANAAAHRLLARLGFVRTHRALAAGLDTVFYVHRTPRGGDDTRTR